MTDEPALPPTERTLERSHDIARSTALEIVRTMNEEDAEVAAAVAAALPRIASAVEAAVARMRRGGRLVYVGAGSSGRLGVLDAAECPPTFGVEPDRVVGWMAGGPDAVASARESAEDSAELAAEDLEQLQVTEADCVVGISAGGNTTYTVAFLRAARERGARTVALTANPGAELLTVADHPLLVETGAEVIAGSTRLKAGTAAKMVLNMLSTASMVLLGRTAGNRMAHLRTHSQKLRSRAERIVADTLGVDAARARSLLGEHGSVPAALAAETSAVAPASRPFVHHLMTPEAFRRAAGAELTPPSLATEGFVHCSFAHQLAATASRHYGEHERLVVLTLDPERLGAELRVEDTSGRGEFPHVYGPIPRHAIREVSFLHRDEMGRFVLPRSIAGTLES